MKFQYQQGFVKEMRRKEDAIKCVNLFFSAAFKGKQVLRSSFGKERGRKVQLKIVDLYQSKLFFGYAPIYTVIHCQ